MFGSSSSVTFHNADLCHRDSSQYHLLREDNHVGSGREGGRGGRARAGAGGTWTQSLVALLLLFSAFLFFFFQVASLLPRRPGGHEFPWSSNSSRNLSVYIHPSLVTALLQPVDPCPNNPYVLFVVPSSINNTHEREAIRRTWGQWAGSKPIGDLDNWRGWLGDKKRKPHVHQLQHDETHQHNSNSDTQQQQQQDKTTRLVFLLGTQKGEEKVSKQVMAESMLNKDMVIEDFVDSYTNLTLKTVFMLKWIRQNCPSAQFIMKTDDDIFVNVPNVVRTLTSLTTPKVLTGNLICGARPIHDVRSKWYTPQYMFRDGHYPNYLSGTAYVLSGELVEPLFSAALSTPYFHLEDVFLTGICARKINVRPTDNFNFSYLTRGLSPCLYKEVAMGHGVLPSQMIKLWNLLNHPPSIAKCKPIKKSKLKASVPVKCVWR
ncbi:hypothetical protein Pmani_028448 [Petrolisthes manimaculis]|uniref:Hexosyltransferase n=1 Tax=Petrolisthes manimaculis TaxID=1843537 RepID=A0AAE1NZH3_9EUCA|nr:hypothetical protein Pmani_028448 [Petrolisthes manimaculis]